MRRSPHLPGVLAITKFPAEGSAADDPCQLCQGQAVADRGDQASPTCSAQRPPAPPPHESPLAPAHLDRRSLRFQRSPTTLGHMAHHRPQAPSPRNYAGEPDTPASGQNTRVCTAADPPIPDPMAAQSGGSAPGYQPGFALSALQETADVRVTDPYIYAAALAGQLSASAAMRGAAQGCERSRF